MHAPSPPPRRPYLLCLRAGTASLAGQVQSPGRTFPRAMLLTIALVVVSYVLPLFIAAASTDIPYATWHDGTFTEVGVYA